MGDVGYNPGMSTNHRLRAWALELRNRLLDRMYWPRARAEFLSRLANVETPSAAIDIIYTYHGAGYYRSMYPNQDRSELERLSERVKASAPKVIVEIGTRDGGTLFVWSQSSTALELLVSIDLPGGIYGGGYKSQREKLYHLFTANHLTCELHLLRADSQISATCDQLIALLNGRPIDFLFIDGDHRYPGVKQDYALYAPLVRPGGLIAFHDIRPNLKDPSIQVFRLWDELKKSEPATEEIIREPYQGKYGIGLIMRHDPA